jgi:hypothetical protein
MGWLIARWRAVMGAMASFVAAVTADDTLLSGVIAEFA